jgi:hypothetical protein
MTDRLFTDVRRFAAPPGRPMGAEGFDRRPRRVAPAVQRWLARCLGMQLVDPEPTLAAYFGQTPR